MQLDLHESARGRWRGILVGLGLDSKFLCGKQTPCPICGGKDRFRFDDKEGRGTFICNRDGAGNGVDLVMKFKGVDFREAKRMIETQIGIAPVVVPKAERDPAELREANARLWAQGKALDGQDIASRYLKSRGIELPSWPICLRWLDSLAHKSEDGLTTHWPAMLAKFAAADGKGAILHRTWLAEPGAKAPVDKPRKMMAGKIPDGGAVRLGPEAETMGAGEGIETALAAARLWEIAVWAATSATALVKWRPPDICKHVIIFGDADDSFTGQMSSYSLAYRLKSERRKNGAPRFETVEIRLPNFHDNGEKVDWNDKLEEARAA